MIEQKKQDLQHDEVAKNEVISPNTPQKKKKICRKIACALSAVVILPIFALLGALATDSGQRGLLQLTDNLLDSLAIEQIEGGLQNGLILRNVRYRSLGVDTHIEQVRLQLDFSCLLQAQICLRDLRVQQPLIQIDSTKLPSLEAKPKDNSPLQPIYLPISVVADQIAIDQLTLKIDQNRLELAQFSTALSLDNAKGLVISPTQINDLRFITQVVQSASEIKQQKEAKEQIEKAAQSIDWQALEKKLTPALLGDIAQIKLPFALNLQDLHGKNWQYQQVDQNENVQQAVDILHWQVQVQAQDHLVQLHKLQLESSLGNLQGKGLLQLNGEFPLDFQLQSAVKKISENEHVLLPDTQIDLRLNGNLKKQTALSIQAEGGIQARLKAEVQLNQAKMPFHLTLHSDKLQYPFATKNADAMHISKLDLAIEGNLLDYHVQLKGRAQGMGIPKSDVDVILQGGLSYANIEKLQLNTLKGSVLLSGKADWQSGVKWQTVLDLSQLNLGGYFAQFPAVLSGKIRSDGEVQGQNWLVNVPELALQGTLSRHPLNLTGSFTVAKEKGLSIPYLHLTYGENKITAQGELGEKSDFNLVIQAPNLRGLLPNLNAALKGNVALSGKITEPNLNVDLSGRNIQFNDIRLATLSLQGQVTSEKLIKGNLDLGVGGVVYNEVNIRNAMLTLSGDEKNHHLQLQSQGKPLALDLNLSGNFDRISQQWKGVLSQVNISSPVGAWRNNQNVNLDYDNKQTVAGISAHCWMNSGVELCFPQYFKAGKNGNIPFEIKKLDLALINHYLEKVLFKGQLQSKGNVEWFVDKPLKFALQINGNALSVNQPIDYRTFKLDIPKLTFNADLQDNNLALKSTINIQNQGKINTDIRIQDLAKARQLGGTLNIQNVNLNLVNQLLSRGENVVGDVNARLSFGGNLNAPLLTGSFVANRLKAQMNALPFDINDGRLSLQFQGNRSTLQGYIQTDDSRLNVDGNADWRSLERWNTRLRVQADRFNVSIPSMAKLKISPDIEITAAPKLLELSGNIDIPWARIAIESLPDSAVSVSSDEVILDQKPTLKQQLAQKQPMPAKTKSGMEIRSDLKIKIGNDVRLNAYGLQTGLHGLLSVRQDRGQLGLYGQINLNEGRYAAFGQDLLIRKGQISFSGLPSQPMLEIEAIRNPDAMEDSNVTAGVNVVGIADSPEVTVFSQPSLPQDQALAYLLTGRSLEKSGEAGSGSAVGTALLGMGLAKSGKVIGGIGKTFGIRDLNIGTQGVGDSSQVVVSGNITPRLQVKYGVGLFDGLAEFTVRYKLLPQLYVQSVSGVNQAFDLLYRFEF
ncbi:translocation/assembly module TamB domain-containing protein [Actinobacillus seminis]|uniref:autotransporter assembly complex protein TamB n=1 Tax=Actinobacillus seminis TaxID=722 RepID=UPI003B941C41